MYIFNAIRVLVGFHEFGSPSNVLLPVCFALSAAVQVFLLMKVHSRKKWLFLAVLAGVAVCMEILLWLVHSYTALLFIIIMAFALACLLGAALVSIIYLTVKRCRHSSPEKTEEQI